MEVFDRQVVTVCEEFAAAGLPCDGDALLVLEYEGQLDAFDTVIAAVSAVANGFAPIHQQEITDEQQINRIWRALDAAFTALGRLGSVRCVDVAVPPSRLAESMQQIGGIAARHGLRGASLCRPMEGVVRSVLLYDGTNPDDVDRVDDAMIEVARMTREVGGVLAGEHGIGLAKREVLTHRLANSDLVFQMRLKSAFDTEWLLNNGKVYPLAEQAAQVSAT